MIPWNKGTSKINLLKSGYYRIFINGKYVRLHRYMMEQHLLKNNPKSKFLKDGRLRKDVLVHHKDENKLNYKISNLECLTYKQHSKIHLLKYPAMSYNEKQKMWHSNICKCGKHKYKYSDCCKECYAKIFNTDIWRKKWQKNKK